MRILTVKTIIDKLACESQVKEFQRIWGEQVEVTEDEMAAVASVFDWDWAGYDLLSPAARARFLDTMCEARAERSKRINAARSKREEANTNEEYVKANAEVQRVREEETAKWLVLQARTWAHCYIEDDQAEAVTNPEVKLEKLSID